MRRILVSTLALLLGSCATTSTSGNAEVTPSVPEGLRIAEMQALEARIDRAVAHGELTRLRDDLEAAAASRAPWAVVEAAYAQRPEDADAAWNRLREVTVMTAEDGPTYWARLGMADVYLKWEVLDQAKVQLDAARKIAPETAPALLRVGRLALAQEDPEGAAAAWREAL